MGQSAFWAAAGLLAAVFGLSQLLYFGRKLNEEEERVEDAQRRRETGSGL